jgi:hypothetical protein
MNIDASDLPLPREYRCPALEHAIHSVPADIAERAQQPVHRDQRAERVAVGVLVRGHYKARALAQALEHELASASEIGGAHSPVTSSISASRCIAFSLVSS